jgi:hypothetical protein
LQVFAKTGVAEKTAFSRAWTKKTPSTGVRFKKSDPGFSLTMTAVHGAGHDIVFVFRPLTLRRDTHGEVVS